jgi:DNA-binding NarL/FixJ family response regulator
MPPAHAAIRCIIVDDHRMVLDLLADAVSGIPGLTIVATATDVVAAIRLAALERIDLLIIDRWLMTDDGMDVIRAVSKRHPGVKCIVIAAITADFVCPPDLQRFVVSVIDKTEACTALLDQVTRIAGRPAARADGEQSAAEIRSRLTGREWEVFVALGEGLSNKELAKALGMSTRTVETHRKSISRKLGMSGAALVRLAVLERPTQRTPGALPAALDGVLSDDGGGV